MCRGTNCRLPYVEHSNMNKSRWKDIPNTLYPRLSPQTDTTPLGARRSQNRRRTLFERPRTTHMCDIVRPTWSNSCIHHFIHGAILIPNPESHFNIFSLSNVGWHPLFFVKDVLRLYPDLLTYYKVVPHYSFTSKPHPWTCLFSCPQYLLSKTLWT